MQVRGSAEAFEREAAMVELATAMELHVNPPPPIFAPREGVPAAKGQQKGKAKDQWQTYHAQKGGQFYGKGKWHQGSWDTSANWWQPSSSSSWSDSRQGHDPYTRTWMDPQDRLWKGK